MIYPAGIPKFTLCGEKNIERDVKTVPRTMIRCLKCHASN
uniref:Uncharacterized protein n=1 Tax=Anguilla anguilla TaxID=7936 RepID=A0A0E9XRI8_ANGAN